MRTSLPRRHDGSYRLLFSHPRMVEDLLRGYLLAAGDGLESLGKCGEVQLSDRLDRREQDLVWRLQGPEGPLYLLLEFQSKPDPQMALRISVYRGLLLQGLIRSGEIPFSAELPLVLSAVLYNGQERWIEQPDAPFRLIDVTRAPLPSDRNNLVRLLFQLERSRIPEELEPPIEKLGSLLAGPDNADLRRAFLAFLKESLLPARFPEARISAIIGLEEIRPMLRHTVMEWTREWERNGIEKGLEQGRREGEVRILVRQLNLKFGGLRPVDQVRIDAADAGQLLKWGERVLTARTLDEVFET